MGHLTRLRSTLCAALFALASVPVHAGVDGPLLDSLDEKDPPTAWARQNLFWITEDAYKDTRRQAQKDPAVADLLVMLAMPNRHDLGRLLDAEATPLKNDPEATRQLNAVVRRRNRQGVKGASP